MSKFLLWHRLNFKNLISSIILLSLIAVGVWYFFFHGKTDNKSAKQNVVPIKVASSEISRIPLEFKVVGNVVTKNSVAVKSRIDSQITAIKFNDGDYIKKDQILFLLDDRALVAQLNQARANALRDKAVIENLKKQYERSQQLTKKGYDTMANLDQAKADYEVAKANLKASDATINNLQVQIDYTKIRSPIAGRAGSINITLGNEVKANDASLVTINQMKPIRVQAAIPQKYLGIMHQKIKSGINITIGENDHKSSKGKVEYIDNNIDLATGSFVIKALFSNEDEKLWPGMFVNLVVNLGDENDVITIPEVAVQHGQKGDFVFVINNNKAEKRSVKVSRIWDGLAVIEEGIKGNELVAIDGIMFLKDGSQVSYDK